MISAHSFVARRFKTLTLVNVLWNICALIILLYFANDKSVYYEIGILRVLVVGGAWIAVNLVFGIIYYAGRLRHTNCRALHTLIKIHFRLALALCVGVIITVAVPVFAILELMGMVTAFFLPCIMLVVAIQQPKSSPSQIFE